MSANDARDARDNTLDALSKLVDFKTTVDSNGNTSIVIGGALVESRSGYTTLAAKMINGELTVVTKDGQAPVDVKSGELGGILECLNTSVPAYQAKLDSLASAIITRVNAIHSAGSGLGTPPPTGNDFFIGTDARSIDVNAVLQSDLNNIASSSDGAAGNNDVALALAGVQSELLLDGGSSSVSQFYNGFVSGIGASIQSATNAVNSNQNVLTQLQNQRSSISGVSLDEEMTNLIKFQHGFDAAAKVINTVNQMYGTLLNMV